MVLDHHPAKQDQIVIGAHLVVRACKAKDHDLMPQRAQGVENGDIGYLEARIGLLHGHQRGDESEFHGMSCKRIGPDRQRL